jgi:hypothetical protein
MEENIDRRTVCGEGLKLLLELWEGFRNVTS